MDTAKFYDFFRPENCLEDIHIIGCGAVGSTLATELARYGLQNFVLYDFDTVTSHNIANQAYVAEDIGHLKTEALAKEMLRINPEMSGHLRTVSSGWNGQRLTGYVFLCVDNIDLRRQIAENNRYNKFIKAMFDFRMGLTDGQHYAADWNDRVQVDNFIATMQFTHEEAQQNSVVSACNLELSVCSTVRTLVSAGVSNFVNFVKHNQLRTMVMTDSFKFSYFGYPEKLEGVA